MPYRRPPASRSAVDTAGRVLASTDPSDPALADSRREARAVVDVWRGAHGYPLLALRILLERRTRRVSGDGLIAQRLKRLASVEAKLRRFPGMQPSRMNDLGGCRAILTNVGEVERLVEVYERQRQGHELVRKYDYLTEPKPTGYRGIHLVYRYHSRDERNAAWNGLRIEIQVRSTLQHAWATAVETVDILAGTRLKISGVGNDEWSRFFCLLGSLFALMEDRPIVPGTPGAIEELREEARGLFERLHVRDTLFGLGTVVRKAPVLAPGAGWFLLVLDAHNRYAAMTPYGKRAFQQAQADYLRQEERFADRPEFQVCLVSTESAQSLRRAFPNYFLDVSAFWDFLELMLGLSRRTGG